MPIQFRCPGCSQPIEVDDPFAGKSAQCPYCRRVITVPEKTDLDAGSPIEARPSDAPFLPPPLSPPPLPPATGGSYGTHSPPEHYGRPTAYGEQRVTSVHDRGRSGVARVTGNLALMLTALSFVLFVTLIVIMLPAISHMSRVGASQPTDPQQAEQVFRDAGVNMTAMSLVASGMQFCIIAGLILGIVSWWQKPSANWRAWSAVGINGFFITCACMGLIVTFVVAASGAR